MSFSCSDQYITLLWTKLITVPNRNGQSHRSELGFVNIWGDDNQTRCNTTRQRPGPDNAHTIWSFSGPKILGPHNDVGKIVRSLSGPETPGQEHLWFVSKEKQQQSNRNMPQCLFCHSHQHSYSYIRERTWRHFTHWMQLLGFLGSMIQHIILPKNIRFCASL